jgi:hypothetical protein
MTIVGHPAVDKIVQCHEELVELRRVILLSEEWRSQQNILAMTHLEFLCVTSGVLECNLGISFLF